MCTELPVCSYGFKGLFFVQYAYLQIMHKEVLFAAGVAVAEPGIYTRDSKKKKKTRMS